LDALALFHRDGAGNVLEPEFLYRPYRLQSQGSAVVFRDHRLSDLVVYLRLNATKQAAADLVGHLEAIAHSQNIGKAGSTALEQPWLVTIALMARLLGILSARWQALPENLYQILSDHSQLKLVTVSEFLDSFPATANLSADQLVVLGWMAALPPGLVTPKNRAWDLLAEQELF